MDHCIVSFFFFFLPLKWYFSALEIFMKVTLARKCIPSKGIKLHKRFSCSFWILFFITDTPLAHVLLLWRPHVWPWEQHGSYHKNRSTLYTMEEVSAVFGYRLSKVIPVFALSQPVASGYDILSPIAVVVILQAHNNHFQWMFT